MTYWMDKTNGEMFDNAQMVEKWREYIGNKYDRELYNKFREFDSGYEKIEITEEECITYTTRELYIDDVCYGEVETYQHAQWQSENDNTMQRGWKFTMQFGRPIYIPFNRIKMFNSCDGLKITTL